MFGLIFVLLQVFAFVVEVGSVEVVISLNLIGMLGEKKGLLWLVLMGLVVDLAALVQFIVLRVVQEATLIYQQVSFQGFRGSSNMVFFLLKGQWLVHVHCVVVPRLIHPVQVALIGRCGLLLIRHEERVEVVRLEAHEVLVVLEAIAGRGVETFIIDIANFPDIAVNTQVQFVLLVFSEGFEFGAFAGHDHRDGFV